MNGWLKLSATAVASALFGAGVAWGTLTQSVSASKEAYRKDLQIHAASKGHPQLTAEVADIRTETVEMKEAIARADERQQAIMRALDRIESLVRGSR